MNDYGSSPDLPDVRRVGRTFLGSRHSPDLPDVQRVGLVSEALAKPKMSGCRFVLELRANPVWRVGTGLAELLATIFPRLFNLREFG